MPKVSMTLWTAGWLHRMCMDALSGDMTCPLSARAGAGYNCGSIVCDNHFVGTKLMKRALLIVSSLALACLTAPVFAKGDPNVGKTLAYTCTGCHGIADYKNAYPSYRVPKIGGQNEQYIINALTGYKKGERKHPTMQAQAQSFSDEDIANIAAYLASLKSAK